MIRTLIGGLVGGVILFVMGFIFWASPLGTIPFSRANEAQNAAVQLALSQNLTKKDPKTGQISGTGTYIIPDFHSPGGNQLYSRGPIATVSFNTGSFAPEDMSALLPGFILAIVAGLLIAFGLAAVAGGRGFGDLARLVVLFTLGYAAWTCLSNPIFMHADWRYWIYSFFAEIVSFILAGLVIARWFMPHHHHRTEAAQASTATEA